MTANTFIKAAMAHLAAVDHDKNQDWFNGFVAAIAWARDHLAAQEPTDAALPGNVANLISDLIDPDDCWFDHHGGCQAHGYLDLTPEQECPHSEAKRLLAAHHTRQDH